MVTLKEWCIANHRQEILYRWSKNNTILPDDVSYGSTQVVEWIFDRGHTWETSINKMTNRTSLGCPYCANQRVWKGFNDLQTKKPEIAAEWHTTKNKNLRPDEVTVSSNKTIWWLCPLGHEYEAKVSQRTRVSRKGGCPICANKIVMKGYNDLKTLYPEVAKKWDDIKNRDMSPSMVIAGSHTKYWWLCPFGHSYRASPENRTKLNGTCCPICASEQQSSFPEQAIFYYLKQLFPSAQNRALIDGKEIDIYIPEGNIGIEYDGKRWHTPETRAREKQKDKFLSDRGIKIIRVKEYAKNEDIEDLLNTIWINERRNRQRNIEYALKEITAYLKCKEVNFIVDLDVDNIKIMEMYITSRKANSLAALRPDISTEWNSNRNGGIVPEQVTVSSGKKVWWVCPLGHEYQMSVDSRTSKNTGCPYCAGQKLLKGFNDFKTRFPQIAAEWHPTKNIGLLASDVMPGSRKKVWWICNNHHEYYTSIASRTNRKSGCPYCSGLKAINGQTDLKTTFPEIAKEWDYEKNLELTPDTVKPFSHQKVWWRCPEGHSYKREISGRTSSGKIGKGNGCPYCSGQKLLKGFNDLATKFPEVATKWHPTMNGKLTPDMIRPYSTKKVWWLEDDGVAKFRRIDSVVTGYEKRKKNINGCL